MIHSFISIIAEPISFWSIKISRSQEPIIVIESLNLLKMCFTKVMIKLIDLKFLSSIWSTVWWAD